MYLGTHYDAPFHNTIQIDNALEPFRDGKAHSFRTIIRYVARVLAIENDDAAINALKFYLTTEGKIRTNYKQESTVF